MKKGMGRIYLLCKKVRGEGKFLVYYMKKWLEGVGKIFKTNNRGFHVYQRVKGKHMYKIRSDQSLIEVENAL